MKILDIRGNLVKIESSKPMQVSSLLKIVDAGSEYLAQILYAEHAGIANIVFAKILANFASPGVPLESCVVSKDAVCEKVGLSDIGTNFGEKQEIVLGELAYENVIPTADRAFLDRKLLIVSENNKCSDMLIHNLTHQIKNLGEKTIILDTEGTCDGIKLTAGLDFKLPLNCHAINFIYEKYFSDITEESKAQIADIFNELKEYAATVPYIPFKTFKSVIDEVFDYSQNLSLYFFKTKLDKLYDAGVFANSHDEVMDWTSLSEVGAATIVVDLSKVHKIFTAEYVSLIINAFNETEEKLYAILKLDDSFADKDFVKEIIENKNVLTSCIVRSNFKFLQALKQNSGSFVIMGGIKKAENFDYCKFLLKNLPIDKYVITGDFTAPVSLIFQLKEVTDVIPQPMAEEHINAETVEEIITETPIEEIIEENVQDGVEGTAFESQNEDGADVQEDNAVSSEYEPIETTEEDIPIIEEPIEEYSPNSESLNKSDFEEIPETGATIEVIDESLEIPESVEESNPFESTVGGQELFSEEEVFSLDVETVVESDDVELELALPIEDYQGSDALEETSQVDNLESEPELKFSEEGSERLEELETSSLSFQEPVEELSFAQEGEDLLFEPEKTEEELLDEQIRKDVDRVYMAQPVVENDSLSDEDLDFIEELVGGEELIIEEELPEPEMDTFEILEEPVVVEDMDSSLGSEQQYKNVQKQSEEVLTTKQVDTPAVPIYAAEIAPESIVNSDPIQQGDRVVHVKFGIGVVEKIFNYGTKSFCSINFENIGRKVLDPNVTELKKA